MHKANTYADDDQEQQQQRRAEQPSTETERRALHFFQTGIYIEGIVLAKKIFSSRRIDGSSLLLDNGFCLDLWFGKNR